jgi:hypothetical protein
MWLKQATIIFEMFLKKSTGQAQECEGITKSINGKDVYERQIQGIKKMGVWRYLSSVFLIIF